MKRLIQILLFATVLPLLPLHAQIDPRPVANLDIEVSGPTSLLPGTLASYRLRVINHGPAPAVETYIATEYRLPAVGLGYAFVEARDGRGIVCSGPDCFAGEILPGRDAEVTLTFLVPSELVTGVISATARSRAAQDPDGAEASLQIAVTDPGRRAHIAGRIIDSRRTAGLYHEVQVDRVEIMNSGPDTADGVVLRASGVRTASGSGWSCRSQVSFAAENDFVPTAAIDGLVCTYARPLLPGDKTDIEFIGASARHRAAYQWNPIGAVDSFPSNASVLGTELPSPGYNLREEDYTAFLVPVGLTFVSGAFGSQWQTVLRIHNPTGEVFLHSRHAGDLGRPGGFLVPPDYFLSAEVCTSPGPCPGPPTVRPLATESIVLQLPPSAPAALMHIRKPLQEHVELSLHVADVSRQQFSRGTEIPLVPEDDFRRRSLALIGIPADARYRTALRIYGPDGGEQDVRVRLVYGADSVIAERVVRLTGEGFGERLLSQPFFAQILSIETEFPQVRGIPQYRIEVEPADPTYRFWAFVSVTNNETQELTTITPRR